MPHLFTNRPRLHGLTGDRTDLKRHFLWETINAVIYKIGGLVFIIGSILFFPVLEAYADIGAWTFFGGSLLYLVVTVHDLAEVHRHWHADSTHGRERQLEYIAAASYTLGTVLFTVGSVFFLSTVDWVIPGAWCFVLGSLLFVLGACINVLQIVGSRSLLTLQLMNLTAVSFVVGAVLFTVASIPYLWTIEAAADRIALHTFLAWQYVAGSVLFFTGGVFNYRRAAAVMREEIDGRFSAAVDI